MSQVIIHRDKELYHHGILGMKWGKRNGPPYPLGSDDHSSSERKAGWRKSLGGGRNEEEYGRKKTESGDSVSVAKQSFSERLRQKNEQRKKDLDELNDIEYYKKYFSSRSHDKKVFEKYGAFSKFETLTPTQKKVILGIALGAGLTVGAVAVAHNIGRYNVDSLIKKGTTLQTLSLDPDRVNRGKHFYAAYTNFDKQRYIGSFSNDGKKSKILTEAINSLKIASPKTIEKELKDFLITEGKNPEKSKMILDFIKANGLGRINYSVLNDGTIKFNEINDWKLNSRIFTQRLNFMYEDSPLYDEGYAGFRDAFYERLVNKGYSGLKDTNDMGWSEAPVIIFDKTGLGKSVVSKLTSEEHMGALKLAALDELTIRGFKDNPALSSLGVTEWALIFGTSGATEYNRRKRKKKTT